LRGCMMTVKTICLPLRSRINSKIITIASIALISAVGLCNNAALAATSQILIDNTTLGYYNDSLGRLLDGTNPYAGNYLFPIGGDPTITNAPEPDLSSVSSILGDWLTNPASLNANWIGPGLIPSIWAEYTETALIYEINASETGIQNVVVNINVDNGTYVWFDGIYKFGTLEPGPAFPGVYEYSINLGDLSTGTHYLQIIREDHGSDALFYIETTGDTGPAPVPAPAAVILGVFGSAIVTFARRRNII
jgi:hypothetical protein